MNFLLTAEDGLVVRELQRLRAASVSGLVRQALRLMEDRPDWSMESAVPSIRVLRRMQLTLPDDAHDLLLRVVEAGSAELGRRVSAQDAVRIALRRLLLEAASGAGEEGARKKRAPGRRGRQETE